MPEKTIEKPVGEVPNGEIRRFNRYWSFVNKDGRMTNRCKETQARYEDILFSVWKNHHEFDSENDGIEISIKGKKNYRTIYRVVEKAEKAGLLKEVRGYYVGNMNRLFKRNKALFDMVFQNGSNRYRDWLAGCQKDKSDIIAEIRKEELTNYKIESASVLRKRSSHINTSKQPKVKRIYKDLHYDLDKLYSISGGMLRRYYDFLTKMNRAAHDDDLKFFTFIKFDQYGLPTGRPYSYLCSTLNLKKRHKLVYNYSESRPDFFKRVGLPDYHEVYDIKSEFPRVNYLFHTGEWKDDSYDFYSKIIDYSQMKEIDGDMIPRGETKYTPYEDSMKALFMRIYFGRGSMKQSYLGYHNDRINRSDNKALLERMVDNDELIDIRWWEVICKSTEKIVGPSIHNLIMWYSFFIETEVKIQLLRQRKTVYNVYDGFYYNKDIKDEIVELLEKKSKFVYKNFMEPVKL